MSPRQPLGRLHRAGPIGWTARHPVVPNLVMLLLLVGGLLSMASMARQLYPPWEGEAVRITVSLPAASPREVLEGVLQPLDRALSQARSLGEIVGEASPGRARLKAPVAEGSSTEIALAEAQQAVASVELPQDARPPKVVLEGYPRLLGTIYVHGPATAVSLYRAARIVEARLLDEPGISLVNMSGAADPEIHIEIAQATLRAYGLTPDDVAQRIRALTEDRSGGMLETAQGALRLSLSGRRQSPEEFAALPILTVGGGTVVTLGEIASVRAGFGEERAKVFFEGEPAIELLVRVQENETPQGVSASMQRAVADLQRTFPEDLKITISSDWSTLFDQRVQVLLQNGALGLVLVLVLLTLFLDLRLAFWVAVGIPTAVLGTFLVLPYAGVSINLVSLFGFLLALGIIVDDAIVTGENIYEYRERGLVPMEAAVQGARDISVPLSFSIITNVIAFIPIAMVPGWLGRLWIVIPIVVGVAFIISWLESLFVLPGHLARVPKRPERPPGPLGRLQRTMSGRLAWCTERLYGPLLEAAMRWRYATISLMILVLTVAVAWPLSGRMGFQIFPAVPSESVRMTVNTSIYMSTEERLALIDRLGGVVDEAAAEHGRDRLIRHVTAKISGERVELTADLQPEGIRPLESPMVAAALEEAIGTVPEAHWVSFSSSHSGPSDDFGLTVELSHDDEAVLRAAVAALKARMGDYEQIRSVRDDFRAGTPELSFALTAAGRALGFTVAEVAGQVRGAVHGAVALRQQDGRDEVTVRVRLPAAERRSEYDIESLILRAPDGTEAPLYEIAEVTERRAARGFKLAGGRRVAAVRAKAEPPEAGNGVMASIRADVLPAIKADFPGLGLRLRGDEEVKNRTLESFRVSFAISLVAIFAALAIPLRSWIQPLIVMTAIPFGFAGAVLGHLLMGMGLSIVSIFGIIALGGVVINAALVMLDYANKARAAGAEPFEAMLRAGKRRFRPIMLTTLTTFGGLAPMIFETALQAQFLVPMAVSLGYGIVFATAILLFLVPCLYLAAEDVRWLANPEPAEDENAPA